MQGTVIRTTGSRCNVLLEDGDFLDCRIKGKFRINRMDGLNLTNPIAVGDKVICQKGIDGLGVISEILERKNYIIRKSSHARKQSLIATNIDRCFLIVTLASPRTSTGFVDRFLATAERYGVEVCLVFNKIDLYDEKAKVMHQKWQDLYQSIGYQCLSISALNNEGTEELVEMIKDKISLLSGHSGAGKSTLINSLIPGLDLCTNEVTDYGKGVHTTTSAEAFQHENNGWIMDTPGIKEFGLVNIKVEELSDLFPEILKVKNKCHYNNCWHYNEPESKCYVKQQVGSSIISNSRYDSYIKLVEELKDLRDYL